MRTNRNETIRAGRLTQIYFDRFENTPPKQSREWLETVTTGIATRLLYFWIVGVSDCALMITCVNGAGSVAEI